MKYLLSVIIVLAIANAPAQAQIARKPSFYNQQDKLKQQLSTHQQPLSAEPYRIIIGSEAEFKQLARTYELGSLYEIPHLLFVIDLQNKPQIYFINTPVFQLHKTFVEKILLHKKITNAQFKENYTAANRHFLLGTLSYQSLIEGYTFEFWEGDQLTAELLQLTQTQLEKSFLKSVTFKTNSSSQEQLAERTNTVFISQHALIKKQPYLALNKGKANGQVHIIASEKDLVTIKPTDIIVLKTIPIALPPIAAIITEQPSTVLSHVNLLAISRHKYQN